MIIYIDTSTLASIYLGNHSSASALAHTVYDGDHPVITSELTDIEIAGSFARAHRDRAINADTVDGLLEQYAVDTADSRPLGIVDMDSYTFNLAQKLVLSSTLCTLDAIHLAACTQVGNSTDDEVHLLSRDHRQNQAAQALGIPLGTE